MRGKVKCSELYRLLINYGWYAVSQKSSHIKLRHQTKSGVIIFPNHGVQEIGKRLEKKSLKEADFKK